jgi:UDP-glucose 4-epimerase
MKILVVGGAGEIGRYLAKALLRAGHELTVLDRAPSPGMAEENSDLTYLQGDISGGTATRKAVEGNDTVIHLAWSFSDNPETIFNEDMRGHISLLEAASSSGVKNFIYTSTATVYGRAAIHPVTEIHPCLIEDARKPLYALGKYTAEELCKYYHKTRGIQTTIFRFWWAFGETISGSHLRDLIRKALNNQPIEMVRGAGGAFLTMADLVRAALLAASKPAASGQTYNIGTLFLTWENIVRIIVDLTDSGSPINFVPSDQWHGPAFLNEVWDLDWSKAEADFGFKAEASEPALSAFVKALKTCITAVRIEGR